MLSHILYVNSSEIYISLTCSHTFYMYTAVNYIFLLHALKPFICKQQ